MIAGRVVVVTEFLVSSFAKETHYDLFNLVVISSSEGTVFFSSCVLENHSSESNSSGTGGAESDLISIQRNGPFLLLPSKI